MVWTSWKRQWMKHLLFSTAHYRILCMFIRTCIFRTINIIPILFSLTIRTKRGLMKNVQFHIMVNSMINKWNLSWKFVEILYSTGFIPTFVSPNCSFHVGFTSSIHQNLELFSRWKKRMKLMVTMKRLISKYQCPQWKKSHSITQREKVSIIRIPGWKYIVSSAM